MTCEDKDDFCKSCEDKSLARVTSEVEYIN